PFIQKTGFDIEDFFPAILRTWTLNGNLVALPRSNSSHALYYNKELFDQSGVANPGDQVRAGMWTFDAMVESVRRLTIDRSGDGIPDQAGIRPILPTNTRVMPQFVMLNGGRIFSPG